MAELINKRNKSRLERLLAVDDPVFDEDYDPPLNQCLKLMPCEKATDILNATEYYFPVTEFDEGALVRINCKSQNCQSLGNILLSIAYHFGGQQSRAMKLISSVEKNIGYDGELIASATNVEMGSIVGNAALSIAFNLFGKSEKSLKFLDAVEKNELLEENFERCQTYNYTLFALANIAAGRPESAERYIQFLIKKIPGISAFKDQNNMKQHSTTDATLHLFDNALLALLFYHCDRCTSGDDLISAIEGVFEIEEGSSHIRNNRVDVDDVRFDANVVLALAYMAQQYHNNI